MKTPEEQNKEQFAAKRAELRKEWEEEVAQSTFSKIFAGIQLLCYIALVFSLLLFFWTDWKTVLKIMGTLLVSAYISGLFHKANARVCLQKFDEMTDSEMKEHIKPTRQKFQDRLNELAEKRGLKIDKKS